MGSMMTVWMHSMQKLNGEKAQEPAAKPDKRFADKDWEKNPFFDFLKQVFLVTSDWASRLVTETEGLDAHTATRPNSTCARSSRRCHLRISR